MSARVKLGDVKETNYRFVVALLLFLAGLINYMDRAALGIAAPFVKEDLKLSPQSWAWCLARSLLAMASSRLWAGNSRIDTGRAGFTRGRWPPGRSCVR
jgi:hypothetical protein